MTMTPNEFNDKLATLKKGESFVYYEGELGKDTGAITKVSQLQLHALIAGTDKGNPIKQAMNETQALRLPKGLGLVHLMQKKIHNKPNNIYKYYAIKR